MLWFLTLEMKDAHCRQFAKCNKREQSLFPDIVLVRIWGYLFLVTQWCVPRAIQKPGWRQQTGQGPWPMELPGWWREAVSTHQANTKDNLGWRWLW